MGQRSPGNRAASKAPTPAPQPTALPPSSLPLCHTKEILLIKPWCGLHVVLVVVTGVLRMKKEVTVLALPGLNHLAGHVHPPGSPGPQMPTRAGHWRPQASPWLRSTALLGPSLAGELGHGPWRLQEEKRRAGHEPQMPPIEPILLAPQTTQDTSLCDSALKLCGCTAA